MGIFFRFLRVLCCMLFVSCTTFIVTVLALCFAFFGKVHVANILGVRAWATVGGFLCRVILGIEVCYQAVDNLDSKRPCIILGNHPQVFEIFAMLQATIPSFSGRALLPVMKQELMKTPFGFGAKAMGGLPIDRGDGVTAIARIRKWAHNFSYHRAPGVVIYPDGTRNTKEKRKRVCAVLSEKLANTHLHQVVQEICKTTIPPRAGGVWALLQGLEAPQCLLVTVTNDTGASSIKDLIFRAPSTIFVSVKQIEISAQSSEELREELFLIWHNTVVPFMQEHTYTT